jgi:hypothetical protein
MKRKLSRRQPVDVLLRRLGSNESSRLKKGG